MRRLGFLVSGLLAASALSASAQSPSAAAGVRILLVGDSTVTDDSGWGRGFKARWVDAVTVVNAARNGRSSKNYVDEGHWAAALTGRADYVLIQFGHNDQPGKGPERETDAATTFRDHLARYVREARAAGIQPVLVTSLTRRRFNAEGHIASDLGAYAEATATMARALNVPLVDLHALSIALIDRVGPVKAGAFGLLKPDYTYDATHLSERGSEVFGDLVATELGRLAPSLAPYLRPPAITWNEILAQPPAWYASPDARRIARNVGLYQRATGGWPKNLDLTRALDRAEREKVVAAHGETDSTIDNSATTTEIRFLARVNAAADCEECRTAAAAGIGYLLQAQYANGGWPQYYPLRDDYSRQITFNDHAIVNVLSVLRDVAEGREPFGFVDASGRAKAHEAVERGLAMIVATQVRDKGRLTAWAAQYDPVTLKPAAARTFEPVALSANESAGILRFLKAIPRPSRAVRAAIDGGVDWMRRVRLSGIRVDAKNDAASPRGWDRVVVSDPSAPPLWARFYEIGTNRPLFADRDRVVRYRLDEIGYERRTGYAWYGIWPADLIK
jgi:PelA/Pel-15E family pectate lyase